MRRDAFVKLATRVTPALFDVASLAQLNKGWLLFLFSAKDVIIPGPTDFRGARGVGP